MNCDCKRGQSFFEPLEPRQMMAFTFPSININPNLVVRGTAYQINGTSGNDLIRVSSINSALTGRQLTIEVNSSSTNPGKIVVLAPSREVQINGLGGNDTIIYSGSDKVKVFGGDGNDKITGGSGPDALFGGAGKDTLDGGRGADVMSGGSEMDTVTYASRTANVIASTGNIADDGEIGEGDNVQLDVEALIGGSGNDNLSLGGPGAATGLLGDLGFIVSVTTSRLVGNNGNDTLTGSSGADLIEGGAGNDVLRGAEGKDVMRGGADDDRLYGGADRDNLDGQAGNDGLFGGADASADNLTGGAGHDRFLVIAPDVIKDLTATDARITFVNGEQTTKKFGGQDGEYTFAAGAWIDSDIETVDSGFMVLTQATGNTRLLKKFNKGELKFVRHGPLISSTGGSFSAAASNGGGVISFYQTPSVGTVFHEIGHNFDEEFDFDGWKLFSGWTKADMSNNPSFADGTGNDGWFHLVNAPFVSSYARTIRFEFLS
jgi:Ca2+-binding RTX toxin-like protein